MLVKTEQMIGARMRRALQFGEIGGVDAAFRPSACNATIVSSICAKGVSGRQPRSITSAPAAESALARATTCATLIVEASTISAKDAHVEAREIGLIAPAPQ